MSTTTKTFSNPDPAIMAANFRAWADAIDAGTMTISAVAYSADTANVYRDEQGPPIFQAMTGQSMTIVFTRTDTP